MTHFCIISHRKAINKFLIKYTIFEHTELFDPLFVSDYPLISLNMSEWFYGSVLPSLGCWSEVITVWRKENGSCTCCFGGLRCGIIVLGCLVFTFRLWWMVPWYGAALWHEDRGQSARLSHLSNHLYSVHLKV